MDFSIFDLDYNEFSRKKRSLDSSSIEYCYIDFLSSYQQGHLSDAKQKLQKFEDNIDQDAWKQAYYINNVRISIMQEDYTNQSRDELISKLSIMNDWAGEANALVGWCFFALKEYNQAIKYFEKSVGSFEAVSCYKSALYSENNLICCYCFLDDEYNYFAEREKLAKKFVDAGFESNPVTIYNSLAFDMFKTHSKKDVFKYLDKSIKCSENDLSYRYYSAIALSALFNMMFGDMSDFNKSMQILSNSDEQVESEVYKAIMLASEGRWDDISVADYFWEDIFNVIKNYWLKYDFTETERELLVCITYSKKSIKDMAQELYPNLDVEFAIDNVKSSLKRIRRKHKSLIINKDKKYYINKSVGLA